MDYEAWRCCRDTSLFCPDEGCPVSYGCARDRGWQPSQPSPRECQGLTPLENMVSHKNYNPREVALARLLAAVWTDDILTEAQLSALTGIDDRVEIRRLIDDGRDMLTKRPPDGMSYRHLRKRLGL